MSSGSHLTPPPAPCAYLRFLSGFLNPQIIKKDETKEYQLISDALNYYKDESKKKILFLN